MAAATATVAKSKTAVLRFRMGLVYLNTPFNLFNLFNLFSENLCLCKPYSIRLYDVCLCAIAQIFLRDSTDFYA